jgi:DNA-binding NtrC family response regulator
MRSDPKPDGQHALRLRARRVQPGIHHHEWQVRAGDGGTLFLDEIGESRCSQVRLLRTLQNTRGAAGAQSPSTWTCASSPPPPEPARMLARELREDLYYRRTSRHQVPPLRERSRTSCRCRALHSREKTSG